MPHQSICPKCNSDNVKPVTIWRMASANGSVQAPPQPMFACQEPTCLHKWARPSDTATDCTHTVQRLIDLALDGAGPTLGRYFCEACGTEIVRPYVAFQ
jgi:hypothetical protein